MSSTNTWINTAHFSLSIPEAISLGTVDENGVFNFITPKVNREAGLVQDELTMHIGPAEAHVELPNLSHVVTDGISFALTGSGIGANIGLAYQYDSNSISTRLDGQDLFMLDSNAGVTGVLIKDDTYVIGNTNVIGKISIGDIDPTSDLTISGNASVGAGYDTINAPTNGAIIEGTVGIGTSSPDLAVNLHVVGKTKMSDSLDVYGSHTTRSSIFSNTQTLTTLYFGGAPIFSPGKAVNATDHIIFMISKDPSGYPTPLPPGYGNAVVLPDATLNEGRSICLQLISSQGPDIVTIKSIAGNINGLATYPFPTALYTKRTFISDGTNWYVEP